MAVSLYPKVPTTDLSRDIHDTNMDRLLHTKGVKPEDIQTLKNSFSGKATKEIRSKVMDILREISSNYMKAGKGDRCKPTITIENRIDFMMALDNAKTEILIRMNKDYDYYDRTGMADQNTLDRVEILIKILKKSRQWTTKAEIEQFFKLQQ